mgnify:CR=1 FL=1
MMEEFRRGPKVEPYRMVPKPVISMMDILRAVDHCLSNNVSKMFLFLICLGGSSSTYVKRIVRIIGRLGREHDVGVLPSAMFEVSSHILGMCLFFFEDDGPWHARQVVVFEYEAGTHCE